MKEKISQFLSEIVEEVSAEEFLSIMEIPPEEAMGDLSLPCFVAQYVMTLAVAFNKFYHDCAILKAEETVKQARLALTELTQQVLCDGCGLLGVECPEEM